METGVSLLVATLDLSVVRLLRDAIRTADLHAAGQLHQNPSAGSCCAPQPSDCYARLPSAQPDHRQSIDRCDWLERHRPQACIDPIAPRLAESSATDFVECAPSYSLKPAGLPPPWKTLPDACSQPAQVIKIIKIRPDIIHKGSLIDFYI